MRKGGKKAESWLKAATSPRGQAAEGRSTGSPPAPDCLAAVNGLASGEKPAQFITAPHLENHLASLRTPARACVCAFLLK